jgi:hypothetical protein
VEEWIVAQWIREGKYPDIKNVVLGDITMKCWKGGFTSAKEVAQDIEDRGKHFIKFINFCLMLT